MLPCGPTAQQHADYQKGGEEDRVQRPASVSSEKAVNTKKKPASAPNHSKNPGKNSSGAAPGNRGAPKLVAGESPGCHLLEAHEVVQLVVLQSRNDHQTHRLLSLKGGDMNLRDPKNRMKKAMQNRRKPGWFPQLLVGVKRDDANDDIGAHSGSEAWSAGEIVDAKWVRFARREEVKALCAKTGEDLSELEDDA